MQAKAHAGQNEQLKRASLPASTKPDEPQDRLEESAAIDQAAPSCGEGQAADAGPLSATTGIGQDQDAAGASEPEQPDSLGVDADSAASATGQTDSPLPFGRAPKEPSTLVFEIGVEEVPSTPLYSATNQLKQLAEAALDEARLTHGAITTFSTPRRIVLEVKRLSPETVALVQRFRGPAVSIAFDEDGQPTRAAEGFARSKNIDVRDLTRAYEGGTEYIFATVEQLARPTETVLPEVLSAVIESIEWAKSQRWGAGHERFVRPVRWLFALWGECVIPVSFGGLQADRITYGHRLLAPEAIRIAKSDEYATALTKAWVVSSAEMRAGHIRAQIKHFEEESGLFVYAPKATFDEVVNLVEFPTTLTASFDMEFLEVPEEILIDTLLTHQRYFPVYDNERHLTNKFLVVSNGSPSYNSDITVGHERVVRPRLADAVFFYREDLKTPLADRVSQLDQVVFHEKLGSLMKKTERMVSLAERITEQAVNATEGTSQPIDSEQVDRALRAALLAKADLVTNAVVEYTALQGIMGDYYARAAGEPIEVAEAIREHYRPRFANDQLPTNFEGMVVALADKADTIAGLFAVGQLPTGSSDPFALRRNAIGIISILLTGFPVSLNTLIDDALNNLSKTKIKVSKKETRKLIIEFFAGRLEIICRERGFDADIVEAVMAAGNIEPLDVFARAEALTAARNSNPELFYDLATAYTRANNLREPALGLRVNQKLLGEPETVLLEAIDKVGEGINDALAINRYDRAIEYLASLRNPIDRFFDDALIMDPDEKVRSNRLRLLNRFVEVFSKVADIGKLMKQA
ncbi:MAG: glycine--tRNA ligase subunit beta [Coriobacteriia bacterium]|nr:glycine--tRNA ligase subunit beta [Coriobacteriia bacterium]